MGIQSEFIESLDDDKYQCDNIGDKWKQTKLAKQIRSIGDHFQVLLFGANQPAWSLFEQIEFDTIFIETHKNMEQMHSIIHQCKKYKYIYLNGMYINESLLKNSDENPQENEE